MLNMTFSTTECFKKETNRSWALKIEFDFDSGIVTKGHYMQGRVKAQEQENLLVHDTEMFIILLLAETKLSCQHL